MLTTRLMRTLLLLLLSLPLLCACGAEEDALPAYVQSLAELAVDADGRATALTPDDGETRPLVNPPVGLKSDSTYRILALYTEEDAGIRLTDYAQVLATKITEYDPSLVRTDAVDVTACWQTGNYINLRLSLRATAEGLHYFGCHRTDITPNADGSRTLHALLIHSRNNDPLHFPREAYLSIPLRPLDEQLRAGRDSVCLTVRTFDGPRTFTFCHRAAH